ncbi:hypothetical protein FACS1894130_11540 [Spirochaetia bacterium]|nr:hypothetical protein FACS1894130_11540 [Spirochaetia bacterium]
MKINKQLPITIIIVLLGLMVFCLAVANFEIIDFGINDLPSNFMVTFLGAIVTALITVVLLNGQTEMEARKENDSRISGKKAEVFQDFIDKLWEKYANREIRGEDFREITSDYYSKVMLYKGKDKDKSIGEDLCKIGELINEDKPEDPEMLKIIVNIVNKLSIELGLGGEIDPEEIRKITDNVNQIMRKAGHDVEPETDFLQPNDQGIEPNGQKVDTVVKPPVNPEIEKFKETIKTKVNASLVTKDHQELIAGDYSLCYFQNIKIQAEYLRLLFKDHSGCEFIIGPFSKTPGRLGNKVNGKFITSYKEPISFKIFLDGRKAKSLDDFRSKKYYGDCASIKLEGLSSVTDMTIPIAKVIDNMDPKPIDIGNEDWINKPFIFSQPDTVEPFIKDYEKIADVIAKCAVYYYDNARTEEGGLSIKEMLEKHYNG